jgi:perosamine synthetase
MENIKSDQLITIAKPKIGMKEQRLLLEVLVSGQLAQGALVREVEREFEQLCGSKHAIAINNGTAALHTALHAIGIKPGDEVITTPFTFIATANAILMCGATPVFVDIDPVTFNIDPTKISQKITKKTKAILVVNLYGQPADYEQINQIAKKHKLLVVEDAAQSVNARYKHKVSGNLAAISCFSFYATKNITSGEGGMITTNSKILATRAKLFRHHGQAENKRYTYTDLGYNYRMTEIQAALLLPQLQSLASITATRQQHAAKYIKSLVNIPHLQLPKTASDRTSVFHQFTLRIQKTNRFTRDTVQQKLLQKHIQTVVFYPTPLHKISHLKRFVKQTDRFPIAERAAKEVLSIPIHASLTEKEIAYIIHSIKELFLL